MKLAIGTVQFGMKYGVANTETTVTENVVKAIINHAIKTNIDTLDTAAVYGSSEVVLGKLGVGDFKLISKLPSYSNSKVKASSWVMHFIEQSLNNLCCNSIHGLLLHQPLDLIGPHGNEIYRTLQHLKSKGIVKKIGISIYSPDDLDSLSDFRFDIVQAPMNLIDRRLKHSGWLEKLKKRGTEVHIRSAFLQGLLLMPIDKRPNYFLPWKDILNEFDVWVASQNLTPLEACFGHLNTHSEIDRIIVGVNSVSQLKEVILASITPAILVPESIQTNDTDFINPSKWAL